MKINVLLAQVLLCGTLISCGGPITGNNPDVDQNETDTVPTVNDTTNNNVPTDTIDPNMPDLTNSKINMAVENIYRVWLENIGKEDARRMITMLYGKTHQVYTGVTLMIFKDERMSSETFYEKTDVTFYEMTEQQIEDYINDPEPYDKAGAYAIQGLAGRWITGIEGDYFNVVGLPVRRLFETMEREFGIRL